MPRLALSLAVLTLLNPLATRAQEPTPTPPAKAKATPPARKPRRDPRGTYMGRPIAPVMTYEGADWLVRETREQEEEPDKMLDALKIPEGATVADVGAGVGYTSFKIAKRVGPKGMVYATDVQPQMLQMLAENARVAGIKNVKGVKATATDVKLPAKAIDLAIMVDVYHECSDPEAILQGLLKALKPKGRLVLVEFRGEDPDVPIKPEHKMTLKQVRKELEPQGFVFKDSLEFLPWQHIIIFEKPAEKEKGETSTKPGS